MNNFSISMALVDYVPVVLFTVSAVILLQDLYNKMSKVAFSLFSAGVADITIAGVLKATWKLLYSANICNFEALDVMFFPVQSIGFLLAGLGILFMLLQESKNNTCFSAAPPIFAGTFIFVSLMVIGLGIIDTVLCIISAKLKKPYLIAIFVLSFICSLCMGYLSSQDFAKASMNWIAEGVNVVGQGSLLVGTVMLHKNGLKTMKFSEDK